METFQYSLPHQQRPPKNWLVESIIVTIFCCQLLGIISIIYASMVESRFYRGDVAGAERAARTAKMLVLISASLGIFLIILFLTFGGIAFVSSLLHG